MNIALYQPPATAPRTFGRSSFGFSGSGRTGDLQLAEVLRNMLWPARFYPHFAPVASEEMIQNRPSKTVEINHLKRTLPLVKASGQKIVQADIDDALDE